MDQATHTQMSRLCFLFDTLKRPRHLTIAQNQNNKTTTETYFHQTGLVLSRNAATVTNHTITSQAVSLCNTITVSVYTAAFYSFSDMALIYPKYNSQHYFGRNNRRLKMCRKKNQHGLGGTERFSQFMTQFDSWDSLHNLIFPRYISKKMKKKNLFTKKCNIYFLILCQV